MCGHCCEAQLDLNQRHFINRRSSKKDVRLQFWLHSFLYPGKHNLPFLKYKLFQIQRDAIGHHFFLRFSGVAGGLVLTGQQGGSFVQ